MTAFLLTSNPEKHWENWSSLAQEENPQIEWSTTSHKLMQINDRFYIMQQGKGPRGIFGAGKIVKPARKDPSWGYLVLVRFCDLIDPMEGQLFISFEKIQQIAREKPILATPQRSGLVVPDKIAAVFDREIARRRHKDDQSSPLVKLDRLGDIARERVMREIEARQGAGPFRDALMRAYQGQCAITGCSVPDLLDAAHIIPYAGQGANVVANGLLLRTDLHTAFDRHLIWIDADTMTVRVAPSIKDPTYRYLHRKPLRMPSRANLPDVEALRRHATKAAERHSAVRKRTTR